VADSAAAELLRPLPVPLLFPLLLLLLVADDEVSKIVASFCLPYKWPVE
jgi:hypothetical protein